jgi:hypothetical protein
MVKSNQVLVAGKGYEGKYVALRSVIDRTVIASGEDPEAVMREAQERGAVNPVIFFVPSHDVTLVYGDAHQRLSISQGFRS